MLRTGYLFSFLAALTVSLFVQTAGAVVVRQDSRYIYHITPWTQMKDLGDKQMQEIIKASMKITMNYVRDMAAQRMIPQDLASIDDLRKLESANREVETLLEDINRWISVSKQRKTIPTKWDLVPDAFFFFVGGNKSVNIMVGGGAEISLGVVVMPVYVVQFDKITGRKVAEGMHFPIDFVVFVAPGVGVKTGVGTTSGLRGGLGLIWGGSQFADPSQFVGAGMGGSGAMHMPLLPFLGQLEGSAQLGALFNDMPDAGPDFYYLSMGLGKGFSALPSAEGRVTGNFVFSLEEFMGLFYRSSDRAIQNEKRRIENELSKMYTNNYKNDVLRPGDFVQKTQPAPAAPAETTGAH